MIEVEPNLTDEDLSFAERVLEHLGVELDVVGDADLGPRHLAAAMLSHARNVRDTLLEQLPRHTRTDALGELKAEVVRQVRHALVKRWPAPPDRIAVPRWRQEHLSLHERNLLWVACDRVNRHGLPGLAYALQVWSDHAHRLFLAELGKAHRNVRVSAPPCLESEQLADEVASIKERVARGIHYPDDVVVTWPEEVSR